MQKWMITGDWELTEERVDMTRELAEHMTQQFEGEGFDRLVFVGDMFREFTAKTATAAGEMIVHMDGLTAPLLIVGNHDREVGADRLTAIFGGGVIKTPTVLDVDGVKVGILPAPDRAAFGASRGAEGRRTRDQALSEALEAALISLETQIGEENLSKAILFFHASIGGAELGKQKLPHGLTWEIPLSRLERWGLAIGGHIHKPQQITENVYYTGGIANWTFSDRAEQFRVLAVEIGDDGSFKVESIPLPRMLIPIEIELDHEGFKNGGEAYPTGISFASTLRGFLVDRCGVTIEDTINLKIRAKLSPDRLQALPKEEELLQQLREITRPLFIADLKIAREPVGLCKARIDVDREDMNLKELFDVWQEATENKIIPEGMPLIDKHLSSLEEFYHPGEGNFGFNPITLELFNFRQWEEAELDFREIEGAIAITGDNALGKSNLIEAILFALFKRSPSSTRSIEDELRLGTSEGIVELRFQTGGKDYIVRRAMERNSSGVSCKSEFFEIVAEQYNRGELKEPLEPLKKPVCETANDIDGKIAELIGSYEFVISTFFGTQKEIDRLVDAKPAEWNQLFLDSLALERFEPLRETSDKKAKLQESEASKLEVRIDELEQQITVEEAELEDQPYPESVRSMKRDKAQLANLCEVEITELQGQKEEEQNTRAGLNAKMQESNELIKKGVSLKDKILAFKLEDIGDRPEVPGGAEDFDAQKARIVELKKSREGTESELSKERSRKAEIEGGLESSRADITKTGLSIDELKEEINKAKMILEALSDPPCTEWFDSIGPVRDECPAWIAYAGGDHIERLKKEHLEFVEKLKTIGVNRDAKEDELALTKRAIELLDTDLSELNSAIRDLETAVGNYENAVKAVELWDAKAEAQDQRLQAQDERKVELKALNLKLESFGNLTEMTTMAEAAISRLQSEIEKYKAEMKFYTEQISKIDAQLSKIEQLSDALQKKREKLGGYQADITRAELEAGAWRVLANAFHRTGIPYLLMERMIGAFEHEANEILRSTDLSVTIETMTSTKKGEARDKIKVSFNDPRGQHPLVKASGYQRAVLGMALRAAMAAVGARFWGAVPEIYVQDEGFERFNNRRHDIARELITSLAGRFTRFVYITHVDSLGDSADVRLKVVGENGRSVIAA